jgi:hypothetical protein
VDALKEPFVTEMAGAKDKKSIQRDRREKVQGILEGLLSGK